jgi:hypothetical protein
MRQERLLLKRAKGHWTVSEECVSTAVGLNGIPIMCALDSQKRISSGQGTSGQASINVAIDLGFLEYQSPEEFEDILGDFAVISTAMSTQEQLRASRLNIEMKLEGVLIKTLHIDSLADYSVLSKDVLNSIFKKDVWNDTDWHQRLEMKGLPNLVNASNSRIELLGAIKLKVNFGTKEIRHRFLVVEALPDTIVGLVGLDLMFALGLYLAGTKGGGSFDSSRG